MRKFGIALIALSLANGRASLPLITLEGPSTHNDYLAKTNVTGSYTEIQRPRCNIGTWTLRAPKLVGARYTEGQGLLLNELGRIPSQPQARSVNGPLVLSQTFSPVKPASHCNHCSFWQLHGSKSRETCYRFLDAPSLKHFCASSSACCFS